MSVLLHRTVTTVLEALFPARCVADGCGASGAWLCECCLGRIEPLRGPRCPSCLRSSPRGGTCGACRRAPPSYRFAWSAGCYEGVLRDAVHALKYGGVRALAEPLGRLAAAAIVPPDERTIVVGVPAHPSRVAERGHDHARALAHAVARHRRLSVDDRLLLRVRATPPQVGLAPPARRANVAGAFRACRVPDCYRVLLVDDVLTTGATADACARALRAAGAAAVDVCVIARAAEPHRRRDLGPCPPTARRAD